MNLSCDIILNTFFRFYFDKGHYKNKNKNKIEINFRDKK